MSDFAFGFLATVLVGLFVGLIAHGIVGGMEKRDCLDAGAADYDAGYCIFIRNGSSYNIPVETIQDGS